ncbi:MAG: hypothetical protein U1F42_05415 [Candidatus Competibacteraceae bacterium]
MAIRPALQPTSDLKTKKGRIKVSGQKPPKEDVQQAEEKQKTCYTKYILAKNLAQAYCFSLFFGKKQHYSEKQQLISPIFAAPPKDL